MDQRLHQIVVLGRTLNSSSMKVRPFHSSSLPLEEPSSNGVIAPLLPVSYVETLGLPGTCPLKLSILAFLPPSEPSKTPDLLPAHRVKKRGTREHTPQLPSLEFEKEI